MSASLPGIIESKIAPPALSQRLIDRPRLEGRLGDLITEHRVVWVRATAGSGKTTAVSRTVARLPMASAWLTVDNTDSAPGRLLSYLEASLRPHLTGERLVASALAQGLAHREAAGLLVDGLDDEPLVLVLDELERLIDSPDALEVLEAVLRFAPPSLHLVLIARRNLPLADDHPGESATVDELTLAFDRDEALAALAAIGAEGIDAETAIEATGGWVTGVLFEAWRSERHVIGMGGEADPLHGYLAREILARLDHDERELLVRTALLSEVTAATAARLGLPEAAATLARLHGEHLPVAWSSDGTTMRCHPRLREYLLRVLERRNPGEVAGARLAHAELLVEQRREEEATEEFLRAGDRERALPLAERTIGQVIDRLDLTVAENWLTRFGQAADDSLPLVTAQLMVLIAHERFGEGASLGDRLTEEGRAEELASGAPACATLLAWCYWHVGRPEDARRAVEAAGSGPEAAVGRYLLTLIDDREAEAVPPPETGGPLDAMVNRVHWAHGNLRRLEAARSRLGEVVGEPWHINALLWLGRVDEALTIYERSVGRNRGVWLYVVGAELADATGRTEEVREQLEKLHVAARRTGSVVYEMWTMLLELRLALRGDDDREAARETIERLDAIELSRSYAFITEQVDVWRGLISLREGDDGLAVEHLRTAVDSMTAGNRLLELSTAGVYLSEASWRSGDEDASDHAARLALETAARHGSSSRLLLALREFPAVLARQLDTEHESDDPWHQIARSMIGVAGSVGVRQPLLAARLHLREFGQTSIEVNGEPINARLKKSEELLAYLASRPGGAATKEELLDALFEGRVNPSARSYLRQILMRLRQALPADLAPVSDEESVRLPEGRLVSESNEVQRLLAQAVALAPEKRLAGIESALRITEAGPYLPGIDSDWARERAEWIDEAVGAARLEAAVAAFQLGRYETSEGHVRILLEQDPYREQAWRLAMSLAAAVGDGDRLTHLWLRCQNLLGELGLKPSTQTERHFTDLRASGAV